MQESCAVCDFSQPCSALTSSSDEAAAADFVAGATTTAIDFDDTMAALKLPLLADSDVEAAFPSAIASAAAGAGPGSAEDQPLLPEQDEPSVVAETRT